MKNAADSQILHLCLYEIFKIGILLISVSKHTLTNSDFEIYMLRKLLVFCIAYVHLY